MIILKAALFLTAAAVLTFSSNNKSSKPVFLNWNGTGPRPKTSSEWVADLAQPGPLPLTDFFTPVSEKKNPTTGSRRASAEKTVDDISIAAAVSVFLISHWAAGRAAAALAVSTTSVCERGQQALTARAAGSDGPAGFQP